MKAKSILVCIVLLLAASTAALGQQAATFNSQSDGREVVPFAVAESGFDTGLAIANTGDFSTNLTFLLYIDRDGAKTEVALDLFDLYGYGTGLDDSGLLPAGGTYSIMLSELAAAAGLQEYTGQVRIVSQQSPLEVANRFVEASTGSILDVSACSLAQAISADTTCGCDPTENCPAGSVVSSCLTCSDSDCSTEEPCSCRCRDATGASTGVIDGQCVVIFHGDVDPADPDGQPRDN